MMTYRLLFVVGIALLAGALTLLAYTVRFYVVNNIRGVRDDLSGKSRLRGIEASARPRASAQSRVSLAVCACDNAPTLVGSAGDEALTEVCDGACAKKTHAAFQFEIVERKVLLGGRKRQRLKGVYDEAS